MKVKMKAKQEQEQEEIRWRTEEDMRTLLRADEIRKDPKRMERVRKMAKERLAEFEKIAGK